MASQQPNDVKKRARALVKFFFFGFFFLTLFYLGPTRDHRITSMTKQKKKKKEKKKKRNLPERCQH